MLGRNKNAAATKMQQPETAMETAPMDAASSSMPLFFSKPTVISFEEHARSGVRNDITTAFAATTNSIPLTAIDIAEAAKYYPIVFTQTDPVIAVAIVGLEDQNYFVGDSGKWTEGSYVPSYVRKYPFVFMESPDSDQLTLCIDEAAVTADPKLCGPTFYEGEQPSAFTKSVLDFCASYQEQHQYMSEFCAMLKARDMLTPQRSDVELANGKAIHLGGFQMINPDKFKALTEAEAFEWYKRGYLALAYYIMQSHSNWRNLLELGNKRIA
jgi:hypothetical protein